MNRKQAWQYVFDRLCQHKEFTGVPKNNYTNKFYMQGIEVVMAEIAFNIDPQTHKQFRETFNKRRKVD